jgi:D-alanine-D-alanine ligase
MRIALVYNLKPDTHTEAGAEDQTAEFDSPETIRILTDTLQSLGHSVVAREADLDLYDFLRRRDFEMVFSIAEGRGLGSREAFIPAMCEMLSLPFAFSGTLTMALTLDKLMCKKVLFADGIPVAPYRVFTRSDEPLDGAVQPPLFLKPRNEGSGVGIDKHSLVHSEGELRAKLANLFSRFNEPVIAEPFLEGREFTVAVLGNASPEVYAMEVDFSACPEDERFYSYDIKCNYPDLPKFTCPPVMPKAEVNAIADIALKTYRVLNVMDIARIDIRCDARGNPFVLDVNPLPGLTPDYSDLPRALKLAGKPYAYLIERIVEEARTRFGI